MIKITQEELRHGSGVSVPAPSESRLRRLEGRRLAPFYAPKTGAVRPQAGDSALIGGMATAHTGNRMPWVQIWSPPD